MTAITGPACIGPNAIIQVADALEHSLGRDSARELLHSIGLGAYLDVPPRRMVNETEVIALHTVLRRRLAPKAARGIARAAGIGTADYLLAHRIPRIVKALLRALPARLAGRALVAAITRHSWTFAGSGRFTAMGNRPVVLLIEGCPICRGAHAAAPICDYYAATFLRLFTRLVHTRAVVRETACAAAGAGACRFEIDWP
jgi:divinyl protochlorophyllide a 8-vinyl-reductase